MKTIPKMLSIMSILLAGIATLLIVFILSYFLANTVSLELVSRMQSLILSNLNKDIENYLNDIVHPVIGYPKESELELYMKEKMNDTEIGLLQWGIGNIYNYLAQKGYLDVFVMLPDKRVVSKTGIERLAIPDEIISEVLSGKKEYEIYMPYKYNNKRTIVIMSRFPVRNKNISAVLIALYPSESLEKMVANSRFGESGYVALVYGTMTVAHPKSDYIGSFDLNNVQATKILSEEITKNERGTVIYEFETKKFAAFERVNNYRLSTVAIMPYSEIKKEAHRIVKLKGFSGFVIALDTVLSIMIFSIILLQLSNLKKNERLSQMVEELNEMNSELEAAFNELETAQDKIVNSEKMAALGKLMVNIAHDINTPIGIIYSSLTEAAHRLQTTYQKFKSDELTEDEFVNCLESVSQLTEIMLRNSTRISELVQSLKRVAMSEMSESNKNVKIAPLVEDVLKSVYPKIRKTKVEIETDIPSDLTVYTNPGAIAQILMNLIDNSLTHAFDENTSGKIRIEIQKIRDKNDKEHLLLTFSDNGKGIDPEIQKRVFEPFFTTKPVVGSGLGLSIVYTLVVEKLGGAIDLESSPAAGTKIIIKIPEKKGDEHDEQSDKNSGK